MTPGLGPSACRNKHACHASLIGCMLGYIYSSKPVTLTRDLSEQKPALLFFSMVNIGQFQDNIMNGTSKPPAAFLTKSVITRIRCQQRQLSSTKARAPFYRNLEEAIDQRRAAHSARCIVENDWQTGDQVDFASNDILSWNATGVLRAEFLKQLEQHPDFAVGSGGSRLLDGQYSYIEDTERSIAKFHAAETGLILSSGFDANVAVWSAIPRPGDVILYDALVHASTHDGIAQSLAMHKVEFPHNDVQAFHNALRSIFESQSLIRNGRRSVIVAVEGVYSMDGDICPLQELLDAANEVSQGTGNVQFVIDEAHSTGLLGPRGAGLACALGLEAQMAVRVHTFGKCMGSSGGTANSDTKNS